MREIKFRVIDKDTKKILGYEVFNSILNDGFYFIDLSELKDNETIEDLILHTNYSELNMLRPLHPLGSLIRQEFTGLKDKNGVEIYSGDLILLGKDSNGIIVGKVVYNEKDFGVPCYCIEEQYGSYQPFFAKGDNPKIWFEVIGNIYENSNLLGDNIEQN